MTDIRDATEVWVSTSKNADYVSAEEHQDSVRFIRADLTPSVKPLEWKPIETAPKDGTTFYVKDTLGQRKDPFPNLLLCGWSVVEDEGWVAWKDFAWLSISPTHWIPSPDGPSDQPTPSDKDAEIERLREALSKIERAYYNEGENVKRRAARMRAPASEALDGMGMTLKEAHNECRRYLNYLAIQEAKSLALQKLAADRRSGKCDAREGERRKKDIMGPSPTVYDGAALTKAIKVLLRATEPTITASGGPAQ